MKRQRVTIACDKCRELKGKCDGRHPICSRCEGYGFTCSWSKRRTRPTHTAQDGADGQARDGRLFDSPTSRTIPQPKDQLPALSGAVELYENLIHRLRSTLDSANQIALNLSLQDIRRLIPQEVQEAQTNRQTSDHGEPHGSSGGISSASPRTYVGKASDLHFIHSIRQYVHGQEPSPGEDTAIQNYSQSPIVDGLAAALKHPMLIPARENADKYLEVYLSTIHIAYPFISKQHLLDAYQYFWTAKSNHPDFHPWLAILNFIFAIGSYYTSFPHGKHSSARDHFRLSEQGLYYSRGLLADCSLLSVWVMLVQCFFLLSVCHTDRCWNVLGFTIRMGQSIGLHVEHSSSSGIPSSWMAERSHSRRTWYSMYVLDRLLALQLGRPMAIHEADFHVDVPCMDDLSPFVPLGTPRDHSRESEEMMMMCYFIEVIKFSHIVGLVIHELYRPSQIDTSPDQMLHSAADLDQRLSEWKTQLPRHLRFDLGHLFEKSISFKRQRNMLAVKYHHLRALIHRPFLCLPLLQMHNQPFMDLLFRDKERISEAERICINEAQQTAHLLHHVSDEQSLVQDFPWWQMISCLICASSILFVAERFCRDNQVRLGTSSAQSLREDAETCLNVFEALSVNSAAAKKAADILGSLSRMQHPDGPVGPATTSPTLQAALSASRDKAADHSRQQEDVDLAELLPPAQMNVEVSSLSDWPSEISNAMEWSLRFLDYPQFQLPESHVPVNYSQQQDSYFPCTGAGAGSNNPPDLHSHED